MSSNFWDDSASWYSSMTLPYGSKYHRKLVVPRFRELIKDKEIKNLIDVGCGNGLLSQYAKELNVKYIGIDKSPELIKIANETFQDAGVFLEHDICSEDLDGEYDLATFIFSIQDIECLESAIKKVSQTLKPGGHVFIFMKHPCFNIQRHSRWLYDANRKLNTRQIDFYSTSKEIFQRKKIGKKLISTYGYHRSLQTYFEAFNSSGLTLVSFEEVEDSVKKLKELPMFLSLILKKAD